ncbi:peroxiredoxin family protein [Sphingobacterium detergens]
MVKTTGSSIQTIADSLQRVIDQFDNERNQYVNFIKNNPNSILSVHLLEGYAKTWGKDTTEMLFSRLTPQLRGTSYGADISKFIALNKNIKVGDKYADIAQANTDDKMIRLSDLKSKVILLEFWGSWCVPCRKGHPELISIYNTYKNAGFEILGIASDSDKGQWLAAIKEDGLPWENITDLKGDKNEAALTYGINHYPTNFLIKDGIIVAIDLRGEALKNKVAELLR